MNTIAKAALAAALVAWTVPAGAAPAGTKARAKKEIHQALDDLNAKLAAFGANGGKTDADRALDKLEPAGKSAGNSIGIAFQRMFQKLENAYRDAVRNAPWSKKAKTPKSR